MDLPTIKMSPSPTTMTREHVWPKAHGAPRAFEDGNEVAACSRCNLLRGNMNAKLFSLIVERLHRYEVIKQHWHSMDITALRLIRFLIEMERLYAFAFVCRHSAHEYTKQKQMIQEGLFS